jgi:hypothetical protein
MKACAPEHVGGTFACVCLGFTVFVVGLRPLLGGLRLPLLLGGLRLLLGLVGLRLLLGVLRSLGGLRFLLGWSCMCIVEVAFDCAFVWVSPFSWLGCDHSWVRFGAFVGV